MLKFRSFYVITVAYVYFTRIIVILFENSFEYKYLWVGYAASELSTFAFYGSTGYKFRPKGNSYFNIPDSDNEDDDKNNEFGLDDGDAIERSPHSGAGGGATNRLHRVERTEV